MILTLIVIAVILLAGGLYWLRFRGRTGPAAERKAPAPTSAFSGVEIRPGMPPCGAATALAGERFLAGKAPDLPLRGCTQARCRCAFVKYLDRRTDVRRWGDEGIRTTLHGASDRRTREDRRDED